MTKIKDATRRKILERYEAKLLGREVTRDEFDSHDSSYEGESQRKRRSDLDDMVECHYKGAVIFVPAKLFVSMTMKMNFVTRKFLRYKEGAQMYGMSLNSFKDLVRDSGALYHPSEKIVLVNIEKLDEYLELFKD